MRIEEDGNHEEEKLGFLAAVRSELRRLAVWLRRRRARRGAGWRSGRELEFEWRGEWFEQRRAGGLERGLKRPSAEILQQLAKGLEVSAESLYVKAGILDAEVTPHSETPDVRGAIAADPALTERQRKTLLDIYESYVEDNPRQ